MGELVVREWRGAVYGCVIPASEELLYSRRMHWLASLLRVVLSAGLVLSFAGRSCEQQSSESASHLGFDRNEYPGDEAMATLRKQFVFVGYWLSPPPGGQTNNWSGKREKLAEQGYGFALLYVARPGGSLKTASAASAAGEADAKRATGNAKKEGFGEGWAIFLDVEEGGRFNDPRHAYFRAWAETLTREHYRPGFYCSGMVVKESGGTKVISSDDIRASLGSVDAVYWVFNDACPPSPGCVSNKEPEPPQTSGVSYAAMWQITRSPREDTAKNCPGYYVKDKSCYAAIDTAKKWHLDLDVASSTNPSGPK